MPSDDLSFDAAKHQFSLEESSTSQVPRILIGLLSRIPTSSWLIDRIVAFLKGRLDKDASERIGIMCDSFASDLRRLDAAVKKLQESASPEEVERQVGSIKDLLVDAARKATNTRSKERVKRIGLILLNAIVEPKPLNEDEVEETMRVAMELGDEEVRYLRDMVRIQGSFIFHAGRVDRNSGYSSWESGFWGTKLDPEVESVFRKLESYGLVASLAPPNNQNLLADLQTHYALLPKGVRFVSLTTRAATE